MSTNALTINNLRKTYENGVEALRGVSLEIPKGDFFSLLGPNGAGKSTLIGVTSGLVNKTSGKVSIAGFDIDTDRDRSKLQVGVVPQEMNFNIFEKVFDIVVTQAGYYGIPRSVAHTNAEKYLRALGLWEKRGEPARALSGGMKRRLMIARGLVHEPEMLILDEPTAGVDVELRRGMWDFLTELNQKGVTIILTTHYLEEAEKLSKNLAIIDHGEIIEQGSLKELLGKLSIQPFVFDLAAPLTNDALALLWNFAPKKLDEVTLEMHVGKGQSVNDAVRALDRAGVTALSMRNSTNRLEELFVSLTKKS